MTKHTPTACLLAVMIGVAAMQAPTPASAGGITVMVKPDGETADYIQQGLAIYSIFQGLNEKNHAHVKQKGKGNAAALSQKGVGNYGLIVQNGKGHTATVSQKGYGNALGVFQYGRNTSLDYTQFGRGDVGFIFQGGW